MPFREKQISKSMGESDYVLNETFLPHFLADTEEEANDLLLTYQKTIKLLAFEFSRRSGIDKEDLFQEGLIGLARAKRGFDSSRSPDFHTYAVFLIRNALREAVYAYETPVVVPGYLKEVGYYCSRMVDILNTLDLSSEDVNKILWEKHIRAEDINIGQYPQARTVDEFKDKIVNRAESSKLPYPTIVKKALSIPRRSFLDIYRPDFSAALSKHDDEALDKKAALERINEVVGNSVYEILCQHYIDGHTLAVIADEHKLTTGRISQIISEAVKVLNSQKDYILGESVEEERY